MDYIIDRTKSSAVIRTISDALDRAPGVTVAMFNVGSAAGAWALEMFMAQLAQNPGAHSVYDIKRKRYIVGSVAHLCGDIE